VKTKSEYLRGLVTSAALIGSVLLLAAAKSPPTRFEEIDVGRINVREPDGTLRMVISNRTQFPGTPWKGNEIPRPDRKDMAGMLFVNDEGTENGGLIQKGVIEADGKTSAGLSLTFDRFRQDQAIQLLHAEYGGRARSMLAINDEADGTKFDVMQRTQRMETAHGFEPAARREAVQAMRDQGQLPNNRVLLGTTDDGASALSLADAQGRARLMLIVTADGKPSVQLFDDKGQVGKTIELNVGSESQVRQKSQGPKKRSAE
jgi:hypothetical protein